MPPSGWAPQACARNLGLLQAVRAAEPAAYLLYKPHPGRVGGAVPAGLE
jgi:capsule polysaccharide export protein KpsC/LpsZ